jgi:hypothetical protein
MHQHGKTADCLSLSVPGNEVSAVGKLHVAAPKIHCATLNLEVLQALNPLAAMGGKERKCSVFAAYMGC